jgi:putative intracellular protease/amidase
MSSILFILTSADKTLNGMPIGYYNPEIAHPFYALKDHFKIVSASPKGGKAPVDQTSIEHFKDDESVSFLKDPQAQKLVNETLKITDVKASDYVAIFVVGGVRENQLHRVCTHSSMVP